MPLLVQLDHGHTWVSRPGVRSRSSVLRAKFNELSQYQLTPEAYEKLLKEVRAAELEDSQQGAAAERRRPALNPSSYVSTRSARYMSTVPVGAWSNAHLEQQAHRHEVTVNQVFVGDTLAAREVGGWKATKKHPGQLERKILSSKGIRDTVKATEQAIHAIETLSLRNTDLSDEADILFEHIEKLKNESKIQQVCFLCFACLILI